MNGNGSSKPRVAPAEAFRLQTLTVDPATGVVRGPAGSEQLDPKVAAVLLMLAGRGGALVTRDELLDSVWPGVRVTEDALTRCVYQLRTQLQRASGDSAAKTWIETLPKRGYRLTARITPLDDDGEYLRPAAVTLPRPREKRALAVTAVMLGLAAVIAWQWMSRSAPTSGADAAAPIQPVVAVLPFDDLSETRDQAYFADGLADEILTELARSGLNVIARNSSFVFRGQPVDIPTVAATLGATYVLEGSLRRSGEDIRVTAQLIDAKTNLHVWSNVYARKLGDVLQLQDDIAGAVAEALHVELVGESRHADSVDIAPEAYDAFLQAHYLYNRRGPGDVERAEEGYIAAVEASPRFARAWAGLAGVYNVMLHKRMATDPAEMLDKMRVAVENALAADPDHVDVQLRAANYYRLTGDFERMTAMHRRAAELNPDDPLLLKMLSGRAAQNGDFERSVEIGRRAIALDPLSTMLRGNVGRSMLALGRCAEAAELFRDVAAITPPEVDPSREITWEFARVALCEGRNAEALTLADGLPPGVERDQITALAGATLRAGDASAALERLVSNQSWQAALAAATVFAWRNQPARAYEFLDTAYARALAQDAIAINDLITDARASPFMMSQRDSDEWGAWIAKVDETWRRQRLGLSMLQADTDQSR